MGKTLLHKSVEQGDNKVVSALLDLKSNVNSKDLEGITPLMIAASKGYVDLVSILIKAGADVNETSLNGDSAIYLALLKSYDEIVQILVENDAYLGNIWNKHQTKKINKEVIFDNPGVVDMLEKPQGP